MFSLMACCFKWVKERREPHKQVTLALIGLDNAGKTTALKGVQGESLDLVAPTVGFANGEFKFGKFDVTVFDLGGGKRIRGIWPQYYAEAHGVIFVLDASDETRLQECKECLEGVLKKDKVRGKRILLLANKQDREGALDEIDICDQLDLEDIVNNSKCPCRVETCSATQATGKRMDPSIKETCSATQASGKRMDPSIKAGLQWLLDGISLDWASVSKRVEEDTKEQKEEEVRKRKEKRERVMREKEARKKREEEERKAAGLPDLVDSDEEDVVPGANPFEKVDDGYFEKKKQDAKNDKNMKKKKKKKKDESDEDKSEGISMTESAQNSKTNSDLVRTHSDEIVRHDDNHNGDIVNERTSESALQSPDVISDGKGDGSFVEEDSKRVVVGSQENLVDGPASQTSIATGEEKKKKKKKKVKKNKTAPMPVEGIDEVAPPPLPTPLGTPSWAQAPGHRNLFKASQKPSLAPLAEHHSPRQSLDAILPSSTVNHRRKELPELRSRSLKPNIEDDEDVMT